MRASALFLFAAASVAAAATSGCGTQIDLIISSCLGSTKPQFDACTPNDWDCLCTQSINVLTCYNNCPSSPDRFGQEQTKVANCNAASAYGTSSKATATATGSSTDSPTAAVVAAAPTDATPSASESASVSATENETASGTNAAVANIAIPAGGVLAAVFGLAALL